jgi:N-formylglutamate deformylase
VAADRREVTRRILRPDFVVSDRDGTTAEPAFTQPTAALLSGLGAPATGRHGIQVEVNRGLSMDEEAFVRGSGLIGLRAGIAAP